MLHRQDNHVDKQGNRLAWLQKKLNRPQTQLKTDTATTDSTDISAATSELTSTSTSEETTTSSETATSTDSTTTTDSTEASIDSTEIAEADTTFDVDTIFTSGTFEIAGGGGNPDDSIFQGEVESRSNEDDQG